MTLIRLFAFLTLGVTSAAWAVPLPKCPSTNLGPSEQGALLQKVLLLGADERELFEEFAETEGFKTSEEKAEFLQEFSGLGILNCGGALGTAQLTGANDVITTVAHSFFGPNCEDWRNVRCTFKPVFINHPPVTVDPRTITASCPRDNNRKDWAVAKLAKPIAGATYFQVPGSDTRFRKGDGVLQVTALNFQNFRQGDRRPTFQKCAVQVANLVGAGDRHDCDTDGFASGSAHLDPDPSKTRPPSGASRYTLKAINVAEGSGQGTPKGTAKPDESKHGFDVAAGRYNVSVPVAGEFRQAILKAIRK